MSGLLLSILSDPILLAICGGIIATIVAFFKGRSTGADKEREKQARRDSKAKDERLEMHREADEAEREAARLSDEEARRRALEWARKN